MTLNSSKALLVVGTLLIGFMGWLLMFSSPLPNGLSLAHANVEELSAQGNCQRCHAEAGLAQGCLSCHAEIQKQLSGNTGYHGYLLKDGDIRCERCHQEHSGSGFSLVNADSWGAQVPRAFKHPHTQFNLTGKHTQLLCEECHAGRRDRLFTLPGFVSTPRPKTFLGLEQNCISCHADIHSTGLTPVCTTCHGQDAFKPNVGFDHSQHFPLIGGHTNLACKGCHVLPDALAQPQPFPFPFDESRGKYCEQCHEKPHRAQAITKCDGCHLPEAPKWPDALANVLPEGHAITGFRLMGAHANVECDKCHPRDLEFKQRYPDPQAPGYARLEDTCEGCHRDVHGGQFRERHTMCMDCHSRAHFRPSTFGHTAHAGNFPLTGAHVAVSCTSCHKEDSETHVRKFKGTLHGCKDCHAYPHGEQFRREIAEGDCTTCHSYLADAFEIRPFDHKKKANYELLGAHAKAVCNDCHVEFADASGTAVRRYRGNPQNCDGCHRDIHRGQFQNVDPKACDVCHKSFDHWKTLTFDHDTMSRFPLEGAHAVVACERCHFNVKLPDGKKVVQYKPLGVQCKDCHEVVPGTSSTIVR